MSGNESGVGGSVRRQTIPNAIEEANGTSGVSDLILPVVLLRTELLCLERTVAHQVDLGTT